MRRALDYLHSRSEVDTSRIGLFGISMGGSNGVKAAALEDRLACLILEVTGPWGGRDTHDPRYRAGHNLNFAPRVSAPVLMVSSEHDGVDRGNELFAALPEPKQIHWHAIDDHVILFEDTRDQVLGWLRRYLGD